MRTETSHGPRAGEGGCRGNACREAAAGQVFPDHADQCELATMDDLCAAAVDEQAIGAIHGDAGCKSLCPPGQTLKRFGIAFRSVRFDMNRGVMRDKRAGMGDIHAGTDA